MSLDVFVFEDPYLSIFNKYYYNQDSYKRISTHQKHFGKNITSYGLDIPNIPIISNGKKIILKTILFFTYIIGKKQFTYVKFEKNGFKKTKHIIFHSYDYIVSRFINNNHHRTEELKPIGKKKYTYQESDSVKNSICNSLPECKGNNIQLNYTKYYRRGSEIYVPFL